MNDAAGIRCLETILKYGMTSQEARAYKVQCIFIEQVRAVFPEMVRYRYPKNDPRKTYQFKLCYKLLRETQHNIRDIDYPLYVRAQLDIIKVVTQKNDTEPNVSATCLVGEKAWKRWLVWKKMYENRLLKRAATAEEAGVDANQHNRVMLALKNDKEFLTKRLKSVTKGTILKAVSDRLMLRWVATKQISPYYALLCPILNAWLKKRNLSVDDMFHLDFGFYRPGITDEIETYFSREFTDETD